MFRNKVMNIKMFKLNNYYFLNSYVHLTERLENPGLNCQLKKYLWSAEKVKKAIPLC